MNRLVGMGLKDPTGSSNLEPYFHSCCILHVCIPARGKMQRNLSDSEQSLAFCNLSRSVEGYLKLTMIGFRSIVVRLLEVRVTDYAEPFRCPLVSFDGDYPHLLHCRVIGKSQATSV